MITLKDDLYITKRRADRVKLSALFLIMFSG